MARILIGNIKGPQGAKGDKGDKGDTGSQGPAGPQGATGPMPALVNGFTTTEAGVAALDAAAGKTLKDQLDQQNSEMDMHFPPDNLQIQSADNNTYPRVGVFENSGSLYIRLSINSNTYLEYQINNDGANANRVIDGVAKSINLIKFD